MQHIKLNRPSKFYWKRLHRYRVTNISWEVFSPPFTTFGTSQYSGEGVELMAARGGSKQLGAHIACSCCIIEQTLSVCNFFTNGLFSKKNCRAAWMENLNTFFKYFLPAAIPFDDLIIISSLPAVITLAAMLYSCGDRKSLCYITYMICV